MEANIQSGETHLVKSLQSTVGCPAFKSSFARSLSFHTNGSQSKQVDPDMSYRIEPITNQSQNTDMPSTPPQLHKTDDVDEDFEEFMRNSPFKKSVQNISTKSTSPPLPARKNSPLVNQVLNSSCAGRHLFQDAQLNRSSSAEAEILRLRKECQNLLEENRRLANRNESNENIHSQDVLLPTAGNSVEEAMLQTQIDTLQWQLTQVESSRQMYHALMEEVARFLERCYQSIECMQKNNKITRSRSINHMFIEQMNHASAQNERRTSDIGSLRNNHNISSDKTGTNTSINEKDKLNESSASSTNTSNSADSYNNFTNFTWRRSPKKTPLKALNDEDAEKLSQEAFRLYRTAQNLLNLKEPILSESKTSHSFHRNSLSDLKSSVCGLQPFAVAPSLQRTLKTRESHNSYQSSNTSDGSVHSMSSSARTETDEENHQCGPTNGLPVLNGKLNRPLNGVPNNSAKYNLTNEIDTLTLAKDGTKSAASGSADDESGFSSMNSFHHEPNTTSMLPPLALNSTMLSNQLSLEDENGKSDNLQVIPKTLANGNLFNMDDIKSNLPPIVHKRFDSAPPIPPKKRLTTFNSLKNENSPDKNSGIHVLWV